MHYSSRRMAPAGLLLAFLMVVVLVSGCGRRLAVRLGLAPHHRSLPPLVQAPPTASPTELLIDAQKKAVMGRPDSYAQVRAVAETVGPILRAAVDQATIRRLVSQDAAGAGMPVGRFKQYFIAKQEADILLESGGDPEAISPAGASGVAQWLVSTGRGRGYLKIDAKVSNALTAQIQTLMDDLVHLRTLPTDFTEVWPPPAGTSAVPGAGNGGIPAARPIAAASRSTVPAEQTANMPGRSPGVSPTAPPPSTIPSRTWTRDELILLRRQQIKELEARRRLVDERFNPQLALFAQTRYLIWLWRRYPSLDWVFEAYHGGEKGVEHTLSTYLGARWAEAGSVTHAILGENRGGQKNGPPLSYSEIFFSATPLRHPATFAYLYSLHDEHRVYWFKLLMAERAIAWYRGNAQSFHDQWEALRPGYRLEDAWYPDMEDHLYPNAGGVSGARKSGDLIPLPPIPGLVQSTPSYLPAGQEAPQVTRPEVLGALVRVARTYQAESLRPDPIRIGAMTEPQDTVDYLRARFPLPPPHTPRTPGMIPLSSLPDPHAAGLALDILRPENAWEARVLQYALSYWEDRERLHFNTETYGKIHAWRIVPNPAYRAELVAALRR